MTWQDISTAPKDGTWILLRGRNAVGVPMVPVVASWCTGEGLAGLRPAWRDSTSLRCVDRLVLDVPHNSAADWMLLPSWSHVQREDEEPQGGDERSPRG